MRRFLKIGSGVLLGIVALLAAVFSYLAFVVDDATYLRLAREAVRDSAGLDLMVDGRFVLERSLRPGITAERVRFIDSSGQLPVQSLSAKRLHLRLALLPLFKRDIRFLLELDSPVVRLGARTEAGDRSGPQRPSDSGWELDIGRVEIRDGLVERAVGDGGFDPVLTIQSLRLDHDREAGVATVAAAGDFGGSAYTIDATLTGDTRDHPIKLELDATWDRTSGQTSDSSKLNLKASGELQATGERRLELALEGRLPDLSPLALLTDLDSSALQNFGPFEFDGRIGFGDGACDIQDLRMRWDHGVLGLDALVPLDGKPSLEITLDGTLPEFSELLDAFRLEAKALRDLGALRAEAAVSYKDGVYDIGNLALSRDDGILDLTVSGRIAEELELELEARSVNGDRLAELLKAPAALSAPFPLTVSATIQSDHGRYYVPRFSIVRKESGARAELSGSIPALAELSEKPARLKLTADTLAALPLATKLPPVGPVSVQTELYFEGGNLRLTDISIQIAESDLAGDIAVALNERPPRIVADLDSNLLDLEALTATENGTKESGPDTAASEPQPADRGAALETPLEFPWLWIVNGSLDIRVKQLKSAHRIFDEVHLAGRLDNGLLDLPVIRINRGGGLISAGGRIDARQRPFHFEYHEDVQNVEVSDWLNLPEGVTEGGRIRASIALETSGGTLAEMMSAANGAILVEMGPARIVEVGVASLSQSVLGAILRSASRSEEGVPYTDYQCGVFGIDIKNGVARMDQSLSLQSEGFVLAGKGRIDLRDGTIELQLRPRARKGLGLSAATLTGGIKISGTLDNLKAGLSMSGLVGSYVASGVTAGLLATPAGGVAATSVLGLRGIWDRIRVGAFTCESTLKRIERQRREVGTDSSYRNPPIGLHPPNTKQYSGE